MLSLRKAYNNVPLVIREKGVDRILALLKYKIRILDEQRINTTYLKRLPNSRTVKNEDFIEHIFKIYYGLLSVDHIIPDVGIAHAQSWVPYLKGKTSLFLYNFFDRNYGIRDPIFYRVIVLDSQGEAISISHKLLPSGSILLTDLVVDKTLDHHMIPEHGTLLIQAFHPKIKTPLQALRFYGFYGDQETPLNCGVHSLTVTPGGLARGLSPSYRSFGIPEVTYGYSFKQTNVPLYQKSKQENDGEIVRLTTSEKLYGGIFFMQRGSEGSPLGIWHEGPVSHIVELAREKKQLGNCKTAFVVPDFEKYAPHILISSDRVGFRVEKLTISIHDDAGMFMAAKTIRLNGDHEDIHLADIFLGNDIHGDVAVQLDFNRDIGEFKVAPTGHVDIYYCSPSAFADQAHSDGIYKNAYKTLPKSFRCRKFAPIVNDRDIRCLYSVSNLGGLKSRSSHQEDFVFVRVITDTGIERRLKFPVIKNGVTIISGAKLLQAVESDMKRTGIVQYEHETANFTGSWYFINTKTNHISVDHFTGG